MIVAVVVFILTLLVAYIVINREQDEQKANTSATQQNENSPDEKVVASNSPPPPLTKSDDLPKKIIGNWKVSGRLIGGLPASGAGKIGTGVWQFYDDGSLKYTTGQYSDLGTWKLDKENFSVSLFALGKYSGYISAVDGKSMTWVTNEIVDGNQVAVTNNLTRIK